MMSAGSAVSDSSTAPRTDCSASRFCGGAIGPSGRRGTALPLEWVRSGMLTGQPSLGSGSDRKFTERMFLTLANSAESPAASVRATSARPPWS